MATRACIPCISRQPELDVNPNMEDNEIGKVFADILGHSDIKAEEMFGLLP